MEKFLVSFTDKKSKDAASLNRKVLIHMTQKNPVFFTLKILEMIEQCDQPDKLERFMIFLGLLSDILANNDKKCLQSIKSQMLSFIRKSIQNVMINPFFKNLYKNSLFFSQERKKETLLIFY